MTGQKRGEPQTELSQSTSHTTISLGSKKLGLTAIILQGKALQGRGLAQTQSDIEVLAPCSSNTHQLLQKLRGRLHFPLPLKYLIK